MSKNIRCQEIIKSPVTSCHNLSKCHELANVLCEQILKLSGHDQIGWHEVFLTGKWKYCCHETKPFFAIRRFYVYEIYYKVGYLQYFVQFSRLCLKLQFSRLCLKLLVYYLLFELYLNSVKNVKIQGIEFRLHTISKPALTRLFTPNIYIYIYI